MVEIAVDIQFWCAKCGAGICNNATTHNRHGRDVGFDIEPCDRCMKDSYEEGREAGDSNG